MQKLDVWSISFFKRGAPRSGRESTSSMSCLMRVPDVIYLFRAFEFGIVTTKSQRLIYKGARAGAWLTAS